MTMILLPQFIKPKDQLDMGISANDLGNYTQLIKEHYHIISLIFLLNNQ